MRAYATYYKAMSGMLSQDTMRAKFQPKPPLIGHALHQNRRATLGEPTVSVPRAAFLCICGQVSRKRKCRKKAC